MTVSAPLRGSFSVLEPPNEVNEKRCSRSFLSDTFYPTLIVSEEAQPWVDHRPLVCLSSNGYQSIKMV